jgi:hypothetical protein
MSGLPNSRRRTWRRRRQSDTFDGPDPDGYALEVDVNRRHMRKGARAMAVARMSLIAIAAGLTVILFVAPRQRIFR